MNNFKSCVPCVCTGSGHKRVCERHDIEKKMLMLIGVGITKTCSLVYTKSITDYSVGTDFMLMLGY